MCFDVDKLDGVPMLVDQLDNVVPNITVILRGWYDSIAETFKKVYHVRFGRLTVNVDDTPLEKCANQ